ncbi:aldo/keto reductase [Kribbella sp. NPDC059898]|uniref:aldo/keto reductase n=1 Tax=Kribbella sp. NPDC059898 TaxID=3346995 RepID=UPI003654952F
MQPGERGDRVMDCRLVGRSGLRVSPVALGTMNFGPVTFEPEAHTILDAAVAEGVNLIDTADVYGADANRTIGGVSAAKGRTEEILGRWFAGAPGRRDRVVLTTKVFGTMGAAPNDRNLSAVHLRKACDASLRRLQTDHIDIYMLHHVDRNTPWDEIWEALSVLRQQGKIVYAGTSNHAAWQLVQGQLAAVDRGMFGIVAEQSIYSLMQRNIELEVLPACVALGIGLIAYSPLNSGLLAGVLQKSSKGSRSASGRAVGGLAQYQDQIAQYEKLCAELGEHPAAVGLAWLLHQPGITAPVIGARTIEHLEVGLRATALALDEQVLARLDEIFPPMGPAPEAYAW